MLLYTNTRIFDSVERAISPSQSIDAEGCALIAVLNSGVLGVQKSGGTANEKFAGVSIAQVINPSSYAYVEDFTVGAGLTRTLTNTPLANTLYVYDNTAAAALTQVGIAPAAGEVQVASTLLTFHSGANGHSIRVLYRYTPTVQQIRNIQGDEPAGRAATFTFGSIGVATKGDIMTSEFDTTVNWNVANPVISLGANGRFTIGGSGTVVDGYVTSVPTPDSPYLGLHINV